MKTHLKALVITVCVFLALVGIYHFTLGRKNEPKVESKAFITDKLVFPEGELTTFSSGKLNLQQLEGKIIIFNFWASWCAPCIEEVPSLISLVAADSEIVVIAVSGDQNKDDISAFLKSFPKFNKPPIYVVQENAKVLMDHFKVDKLPESFIFDTKRAMVKKISGTINWHTSDSVEYFKELRKK